MVLEGAIRLRADASHATGQKARPGDCPMTVCCGRGTLPHHQFSFLQWG
jgi:hypothetical protein